MHVYSDMLNKLVPHEMISLKSVDEWQQVFNMNIYVLSNVVSVRPLQNCMVEYEMEQADEDDVITGFNFKLLSLFITGH